MRIFIVGCGKIGQTLAQQLVAESHDVTIIDTDERVLANINNTLDVICYAGNGASYLTLRDAGVQDADLIIAVTESDEVNMLCCLTAHKLGARHTVARVRNPGYFEQLYFLKEELGLSMVINPELAAAQEIARILRFPSAAKVELFAKGRAELASFRLPENSPLIGVPLSKLPQKTGLRVLFCAVERDGDVFIPDGAFTLRAGDRTYITGATDEMAGAFRRMHMLTGRVRDVIIGGGGRITYYLAGILTKAGMQVKIIERSSARAQELVSLLPKCTILHGDVSNHELLLEEGLSGSDAFVALTGLDEGNILAAMYAGASGARKVIAKVNNPNLVQLIRDGRLESIVSPRDITANRIVAYVRAVNASKESSNVESLFRIVGGKVEVLEFHAAGEGAYLHVPFKDLALKPGILVACLVRNGKAIIPGGLDRIEPRDGVLIVTKDHHLTALSDILMEQ
ncbi:MAG: Trk system potassium transporter TrkA [bacterium]|nr:Trk system potassium transporter TrkA [bacterium]